MPDLPDNLREALETELAGVEARLARADDNQRATLQARADLIRTQLGVPVEPPKARRRATGKEARPDDGATEVR